MTIRQSLALVLATRHSTLAVAAIQVVILARLLTPHDFGQFATAVAGLALLSVVSELGLRSYLIHESSLTDDKRRAVFGMSLVVSWTSVALIWLAILLIPSSVWGDQVRTIVAILSLGIALQPIELPVMSLLDRQLLFGKTYFVKITCQLVAFATATLLAWRSYGAVSLAVASLASSGVTVVFAVVLSRYAPFVRPSLTGWRNVLRFAGPLTLIDATRQAVMSAVHLVIATMLGFSALGLLSRADRVVQLFNASVVQGVGPAVFPILSEQLRDGNGIRRFFIAQYVYLSALAWPFFLFLAVYADPVVYLLLGPQWDGAVAVARILALAGLAIPVTGVGFKFVMAAGRVRAYVWRHGIVQVATLAIVSLGALVSLEAACIGLIARELLKAALYYDCLRQPLRLGAATAWRPVVPSLAVTVISLLAPLLIAVHVGSGLHHNAVALGIAATALGASWLAGVWAVSHPIKSEIALGVGHLKSRLQAAR